MRIISLSRNCTFFFLLLCLLHNCTPIRYGVSTPNGLQTIQNHIFCSLIHRRGTRRTQIYKKSKILYTYRQWWVTFWILSLKIYFSIWYLHFTLTHYISTHSQCFCGLVNWFEFYLRQEVLVFCHVLKHWQRWSVYLPSTEVS